MTSKAGAQTIVDRLQWVILQTYGRVDEVEGAAEISQADVAALGLLGDLYAYFHVEFQDLSLLFFVEIASLDGDLGVAVDNLP